MATPFPYTTTDTGSKLNRADFTPPTNFDPGNPEHVNRLLAEMTRCFRAVDNNTAQIERRLRALEGTP